MLRSFIESDHNDRYKVMQATWRDDPDDRPTFTQLASIMGDFLEENVKQVRCTWMEKKKGGWWWNVPIISSQSCQKQLHVLSENLAVSCFENLSISFCIMILILIYIICKFV